MNLWKELTSDQPFNTSFYISIFMRNWSSNESGFFLNAMWMVYLNRDYHLFLCGVKKHQLYKKKNQSHHKNS